MMLAGVNKVYEHGGKEYHLQAEDLGREQACFEVRVYEQGTVRWHKRVAYAEVLQKPQSRQEQEEELRALMEKALITVQAAIAKGKLA
jgi:hypothetical protein